MSPQIASTSSRFTGAIVPIGFVLMGCGDANPECERIKDEKHELVEQAQPLYQVGCDLDNSCRQPDVVCGQEAVERASAAAKDGERIVVRYVYPASVYTDHQVWNVHPSRGGVHFDDDDTDFDGTTDEIGCEWRKQRVDSVTWDEDGRLLVPRGEGTWEIQRAVDTECSRGTPAHEPK